MTNEQIIFNEVCSNYDSAQRHDLVSRFYTAEQVQGIAAGLELVPDDNGNTPDPIESAESLLCAGLFHTWAEWHRDGLTVKRGEKAAITCELWKFNDKKKQPAPDADELTKAAAEQDKGYYYLAKAHLFHRGQVEKQQPKPAGRFKSLDEIKAYNKMLADQRKAAKAATVQQDKPQSEPKPTEQPAPAPKQKAAPSAADLKKAERKAMREFMAVSEEDRPAQAKALAKWRETRQTVADAESTPKTAAPAPAPEPEAKPQTKAAPAASADSAPAYCEQISFC
nr:MAG: protein of unknown function DUF1738 [Bacteriophage sp.]